MATIAVFIALGGGAYAAGMIGPSDIQKNAVRAKHIKKRSITPAHLKPATVVRVKANPVTDSDPCSTGKTAILCGYDSVSGLRGWSAFGEGYGPPIISRDGYGTVRFSGAVKQGPPGGVAIFILPKGFRPSHIRSFAVARELGDDTCGGVECDLLADVITVLPNGQVHNRLGPGAAGEGISLDGVVFTAR